MYSTIPEFSFALLLDSVKLIIIMCGILGFSIKKEKKWPFVSLGVAAGLTALWVLVPFLVQSYFSTYESFPYPEMTKEHPGAAMICKVITLNPVSLPVTVILTVFHLITGKKKMLLLILSELTISVIDEVVHAGVGKIFNTGYRDYYLLTTSLTIIILALPAYIIQSKKKKSLDYPLKKMGAFYLIMLVIAQIFVLYYASSIHNSFGIKRTYLTSAIAVIIMIECAMIYTSSRKDYYYNLSVMNQKMLDVQENYYMKLLDHQDELRKFRHDLNNHLISVEALIDEGKYDEVKKYFSEVKGVFTNSNPEVKTGNTIVSAIASDYIAKYPDVKLNWNGMFPDELAISNTDICTMFSNVLGNAFENSAKCKDDKTVDVTVETITNSMIVTVRNTVAEKAVVKNGAFISSKADKGSHGIGTQNIKKCVELNNGIVEYKFDETMFEVKIILPNAMKVF
ncbi:MAG: GHKL domain-containing protein [Oscillospiraceae bacterium]|nr:GHKL domain-containing protein [Oscillospiraceae bacterium]